MAWITTGTYLTWEQAMNNAQMAVNALLAVNPAWTKESLSALVGNMYRESTINPVLYEVGYPWEADRGYGLVQWTPRSKLSNWADSMGLDYTSGDTQMQRIQYESMNNIQWLQQPYYNPTGNIYTFTEFITNSRGYSLEILTRDFCWHYERPAISYGEESLTSKGIPFAQDAYNRLDFTGAGSGLIETYLLNPVPNATAGNVTSRYGWRTHPITGLQDFHNALDIATTCSSSIVASLGGTVTQRDYPYPNDTYGGSTGYGNWIEIEHGGGYFTRYAHLESITVSIGQQVTAGQTIGTQGSTGSSTGCHLHFELKKTGEVDGENGNTIDPYPYLFEGVPIFAGGGTGGLKKKKKKYKWWLYHDYSKYD